MPHPPPLHVLDRPPNLDRRAPPAIVTFRPRWQPRADTAMGRALLRAQLKACWAHLERTMEALLAARAAEDDGATLRASAAYQRAQREELRLGRALYALPRLAASGSRLEAGASERREG